MPVALLLWLLLLVVAKNEYKLILPLIITFLGAAAFLKLRKRMDNNLSKNFTLNEFQSKDGAKTPPDIVINLRELAKNLQVIRDYVNKPITILSGYRSPAHNAKVGGAKFSQHLRGKAADIKIQGLTPGQIATELEKLIALRKISDGGIGIYPTFVHYDIRTKKARW